MWTSTPRRSPRRSPTARKLREVFREFELRDPLRRLEEALGDADAAAPAPAASTTLSARLREGAVGDIASLPRGEVAIAMQAPEAAEGALFTEETEWRFAAAAGGQVLVGAADGPEALILACGERPVLAHDVKSFGAVPAHVGHDTLLGAFLLEPARRGFPFREVCEERGFATDLKDPRASDAVLVQALTQWQREQIAERGLRPLLDEIELPLIEVLRGMEVEGVRLNTERLAEISRRVKDEVATLEREIWELAGTEFTIGSPQQLGEILFEKLGLSRKRRGKTGFSTDARVLQAIRDEHAIVPKIERWRELNQLVKTYLDVLPALVDSRSRIHTTFLQAGATTGRLASTNPNMQNVPVRTELGREIRGCFEAEAPHVLISADYSQVELRVLAHVADEPVLREIFKRGEDVHTATGSVVFGKPAAELTPMDRSKSKMINYGIVYGLSDYGLADRLNIPREEAKAFIDAYLERFPKVAAFIAGTIEQATEQGYVTTLFGRRRQIPELKARNYQVRTLGERLAVNTVIQGTAADVMKLAMIALPPCAACRWPRDAPDPHDPRRAAVRGAAGGERGGGRADPARDGGPVEARPAARGRRRRRRELARGQVADGSAHGRLDRHDAGEGAAAAHRRRGAARLSTGWRATARSSWSTSSGRWSAARGSGRWSRSSPSTTPTRGRCRCASRTAASWRARSSWGSPSASASSA